MLTALSNPRTLVMLAIVVVLVMANIGPVWSFLASKLSGIKAPSLGIASAHATRTPGDVLDCLNADLAYLRANTDAPAELLTQVEAVAPYLMHVKPVGVAPTAPQAPGVAA